MQHAARSAEVPDDLRAWRQEAAEQSQGSSTEPVYAAVQRRLVEVGAAGDALDYGAGRGELTRRLHRSGRFRTLMGADLYPRAADLEAAIGWIAGDLNESLPHPSGSFDTIVAAEVIEHLENPRAVCRDLFRLLRRGGTVLVTTPNNESWRSLVALLFRGHFVMFGGTSYPAHITALTRLDLERALREAGFEEIAFSFTDVGGIPGRPAQTWQTVLGPLAKGLRFSDNVLVTARKP